MSFPWLSLAGIAGTAIANGIASRKANKVNQKQYEEVRNYNTPRSQMSRFRAAGLNPNLIYTQTNEAEQRPEWKPPQFDFSSLGSSVATELGSYQNIKESKARVDNLFKQNKVLDEQILGLTIENRFKQDLTKKQIDLLDKQMAQIDKAIENVDFEQDFKNRSLNNESIKAIWSFALQYATLGLQKISFLEKDKFEEFKRQFNLTHKGSSFFDEFIKQITGSNGGDAIKILAKALAQMFLSGFSS